MHQQI